MHLRVITRAASTAIAAALILTACSGDPQAAPPPDPLPSETVASETPEPSESATPDAETAEEFIRRWPVVETAMINSGDTAEYRSITKNCEPCAALADQIEGFYAKGGYAETDGWEVVSIKKVKPVAGGSGTKTFVVRTIASPTEYRESANAPTKRLKGGRVNHQVIVKEIDSGWVLIDTVDVGSR